MNKFIEFMATSDVITDAEATDLKNVVKDLRDEIVCKVDTDAKKVAPKHLKHPSSNLDPLSDAMRIVTSPVVIKAMNSLASGDIEVVSFLKAIASQMSSGKDAQFQKKVFDNSLLLTKQLASVLSGESNAVRFGPSGDVDADGDNGDAEEDDDDDDLVAELDGLEEDPDDLVLPNYDSTFNLVDEIDQGDWQWLIDVAIAIRDLAQWRWLFDSQMIGVRVPGSDEIWYCTIMGYLGEHLAVTACRGEKGLAVIQAMESHDGVNPMARMLALEAISVSFEDKKDLAPPDLYLYSRSKKNFKGPRVWPQFLDYTPSCVPWVLNRDQVVVFTTILTEVLEITRRSKDDKSLIPDIEQDGRDPPS